MLICEKRVSINHKDYNCLDCYCKYDKTQKAFSLYIVPMRKGYAFPQESIKAYMFKVGRYSQKQADKAKAIFWQVLESHIAIWCTKYVKA